MQNKKPNESQFIVKITQMMKQYPDSVDWTENGTQLHLYDIDIFCEKILPQYFRHSNFNSFIRQLNIYSFHKTKKVGRSMSFKNQIFKKGNENNFFLIQRKKKFKELQNFQERFQRQCENLIQKVNSKSQITSQTKEAIISLLEYKFVSHVNLKRMKCQLDALYKDLKDSRNKKVQEIGTELKSELLSSISQLASESKKIDQFIAKNFLKFKKSPDTKQSLEPIPNEKIFNRQFQSAFSLSHNIGKNREVMTQEASEKEKYCNEEVKQNIREYNSFNVFLQEFKTKKDHFTYDHKLYHPFNSQNSFMYLPNYIGGPSQIPYDGKYNCPYQNKIEQNHESDQKNLTFDDYDQSASISFVKNLSEQEIDVFSTNN